MPKGPFYFHPLRALCSVYTRSLSTTAYRKSSHKWRGETVCVYRWAWPYKELLLKNRLAQLVLAEAGSFPTSPIDGFAARQRTSVVDWITNNSPSSIDARRTPTLSAGPFILSWFLNGAQASQSQDLFRVRSAFLMKSGRSSHLNCTEFQSPVSKWTHLATVVSFSTQTIRPNSVQ